MYDGATKIQTPFDIKMGNTVYEGQGTASQIYVTSKATITFGTGDVNWWDFPQGAHISVFGSDFQSAGPNAGITVTTTETTLAVDWDLHLFGNPGSPLTNVNWTMTVNPTTGEWTGVGTVAGNTTQLYNGPRTGVRLSAGQAVQPMTNVTNETLTAQITEQTAVVATETAVLATLTEVKTVAVTELATAQTTLTTETQTLSSLQSVQDSAITTANQLADTAIVKVTSAITAMTNAVSVVQSEIQAPPAPPVEPTPPPAPPVEPTPEPTPVPAPEPEPQPVPQPEPQPQPEPTPEPEPETQPEPSPEPPKRSNTCSPSKVPNSEVKEENKPSRARSDVGLVAPATAPRIRPFATPAIILNVLTLI